MKRRPRCEACGCTLSQYRKQSRENTCAPCQHTAQVAADAAQAAKETRVKPKYKARHESTAAAAARKALDFKDAA